MKYMLFLWICCLSNCYAQTTNENSAHNSFLYASSLNELTNLWNELNFVSKTSIMPKDISEQWWVLEQVHNLTLSINSLTDHESSRYDSIIMLATIPFKTDSLMKGYSLLSKELSTGIDWSFDAFVTNNSNILLRLVLLQNEKTILYNVKKRLNTGVENPQLIHYSVISAAQYVSTIDWYIATIKIESFGVDPSKVKVFVEDVELPIINGVAELKFKPTIEGGERMGYNNIFKKKWNGKIIVEYGKVFELPIEQIYYVGDTYAYIQGASVNALYEGCANELMFLTPSLGIAYNPKFGISNPEKNRVEALEFPGNVIIIPLDRKVEIKLYSDSIFLRSFVFTVRFVPPPSLLLTIRGQAVDQLTIIRKELLLDKTLLKLKSDESFSQFLPKDARFLMREYSVSIVRGGKTIKEEKFNLNANEVEFKLPSSMYNRIQSGDAVIITATKLVRITYENKKIEYISKVNPSVKFDIK